MTFLHFVRRAHLYMGLFLLPWIMMYGASSYPINHSGSEQAVWTRLGEHQFDAEVPAAGGNLRPLGRQMMQSAGIEGGYGVYRANARQIDAFHPNFLEPVRIRYQTDQKRLIVERREVTIRSFISGLHTRGGYDMDGFGDSAWAVFVDVVSVALLLWIASGMYMWWHLPSTRRWGWMALTAGIVSFGVIIFSL